MIIFYLLFLGILSSDIQIQQLKDDKPYVVGNMVNISFIGTWKSPQENQMDGFLNSQSGEFEMLFVYNPNKKPNNLRFNFLAYQGNKVENNLIVVNDFYFELKSQDQNTLEGKQTDIKVQQGSHIFNLINEKKCTFEIKLDLKKDNGESFSIDEKYMKNININGQIKSDNCKIDIEFQAFPKQTEMINFLIFFMLQILFCVLSLFPVLRAVYGDDMDQINSIGMLTILGNLLIETIFMMLNLTFGMKVLQEYYEFLLIISVVMMTSLMFKMKLYLQSFDIYIMGQAQAFNEREINTKKFKFMMVFIVLLITAVIAANAFIQHYYILIALFCYPLFQIYHNAFYVISRKCFIWNVHLYLIFTQISYPIAMRCGLFPFFKLNQDLKFCWILLGITLGFLFLMYLQKLFGRCFFLPKKCIPGYFEYNRKISKLENKEENCPICFSSLLEDPDAGDNDLEKELLQKEYMETPCKHKFHPKCLKQWMNVKLVCPYCRAGIPPFD